MWLLLKFNSLLNSPPTHHCLFCGPGSYPIILDRLYCLQCSKPTLLPIRRGPPIKVRPFPNRCPTEYRSHTTSHCCATLRSDRSMSNLGRNPVHPKMSSLILDMYLLCLSNLRSGWDNSHSPFKAVYIMFSRPFVPCLTANYLETHTKNVYHKQFQSSRGITRPIDRIINSGCHLLVWENGPWGSVLGYPPSPRLLPEYACLEESYPHTGGRLWAALHYFSATKPHDL
jgi:hypothetical protein